MPKGVYKSMSDPPHDTVPAESDRLLDAVLDAAASLIVVVTPAGELLRWNRACERLLGYTAEELRGGNGLQLLVPEDEHERVRDVLAALVRGESPVPLELHWRTKRGELRRIAWSNTALTAPDGRVSHVVATGIDVTDARAMEQRLRRLADYDALTGLVNRRRFEEELNRHLARGHRYGLEGSLLVLDLDNFKQINDSHGHREGDRVLSAVAGALALRMRESDTVGRIGGDEFAVLLPRGGRTEAQRVVGSLREAIAAVATPNRRELRVSIGHAEFGPDTESVDDILSAADAAMYADKRGEEPPGPHLRSV